jgi:hypothetical protein
MFKEGLDVAGERGNTVHASNPGCQSIQRDRFSGCPCRSGLELKGKLGFGFFFCLVVVDVVEGVAGVDGVGSGMDAAVTVLVLGSVCLVACFLDRRCACCA